MSKLMNELIQQNTAMESFRQMGEAAQKAGKLIAEAIQRFIAAMIEDDRLLIAAGFQPSARYKLAGSPYGRNSRGKKKWLLEQKRKI
jgi:hypothetical protein